MCKFFIYLLIIILQFFSGSILYAHIFARKLKIDISKVNDGNPGSSNLWRTAGWKYGIIVLFLDFIKGTFPLFLFIVFRLISNPYIISLAALSGIMGHAFSPMNNFKGGKAVTTSFGAWSVLTKWEGPVVLGIVFSVFSLYKPHKTTPMEDSIRTILGFIVLLFYVIFKFIAGEKHLLLLYFGNLIIIIYKNRRELSSYINIISKK